MPLEYKEVEEEEEEDEQPVDVINVLRKGIKMCEDKVIDLKEELADINPTDIAEMIDLKLTEAGGEGPHVIIMWREYWMSIIGNEETAMNTGHDVYCSYTDMVNLTKGHGFVIAPNNLYYPGNRAILISTYKGNVVFLVPYEMLEVF